MVEALLNQWTITNVFGDEDIKKWAEAFLVDKHSQNLSPGTIHFYKSKLQLFTLFCVSVGIEQMSQLTPILVREYLLHLEQKGHNPGGVHAAYRTLRAFLYWWEKEFEPEAWKNPILKVKAPKVSVKPLEPVSISQIEAMIATCNANDFFDLRDKAFMLFLLDTGARASETCAVNLGEIDLQNGSVLIRSGKGGKPRTVFLGKKARRALRRYLKSRGKQINMQTNSALWVNQNHFRLTYWGINQIIRRRAKDSNIEKPSLHDFRRAFALNFLRNGGDVYSLQNLMGHADLQVLRRYLAQTVEDIRIAHIKYSPVDNSSL
jgi:site-specific recombinase XerD